MIFPEKKEKSTMNDTEMMTIELIKHVREAAKNFYSSIFLFF